MRRSFGTLQRPANPIELRTGTRIAAIPSEASMCSAGRRDKRTMKNPLHDRDCFDEETGELNAIVDTPKGSRNKFKYDEKKDIFRLTKMLPVGSSFPFDFGYVPSTRGEDGDPLDLLILMDEPAFTGCLVPSRPIGVLVVEQSENGKTTRNDRVIVVASDSQNHSDVRYLGDLNSNLIEEIEHFFISYNEAKGKRFEVVDRAGPDRAEAIVKEGEKQFLHSAGSRKPKRE